MLSSSGAPNWMDYLFGTRGAAAVLGRGPFACLVPFVGAAFPAASLSSSRNPRPGELGREALFPLNRGQTQRDQAANDRRERVIDTCFREEPIADLDQLEMKI